MSIELKHAAEKALVVLGSATSFMSRKARDQHESVVAELRTAIQRAESEPVAWPLRAQVWKRESTQEWVLEIAGTLGDTDMNIRHTQPLSVAYENVPGLPTFYTHPAPGVPDGYVLVRGLVEHIELNTCTHEETHRGGAIWEVCDSCGARWADDEGGRPTFKWPPIVEKARAELAAAQAKQGQP